MQSYPAPEERPENEAGPAGRWAESATAAPIGPVDVAEVARTPSPPPAAHPPPTARDATPQPGMMGGDGFGTLLEPVLRKACDGRLSEVTWFRTDWQRGGALTGYATYRDDDDADQPVVVKLPVPPAERQWLAALQPFPDTAPRLWAHGEALNGYDFAWVVMERLPYGPLGSAWQGAEFDLLVEAAGRFYAAAAHVPPTGELLHHDWEEVLDRARKVVRLRSLPEAQRWSAALKRASRKLKQWIQIWTDRPADGWCHGDLHLGNALTRHPAPHGPALLIDFARTRTGHWLEDAVYFEHLFWSRRDRLAGRKLCRQIAHERKQLGLGVEADWPRLAQTKRALLALSTPAQLQHVGDPHHVRAALEVLEAEAG